MLQDIPGFSEFKIIKESSKSIIYQAFSKERDEWVIIKTVSEDYPTRQQIARLQHEHVVHQSLNHIQGVNQSYSLIDIDNKPAMVMEYFPGTELSEVINAGELGNLELFFSMAVEIVQILGEIHQQHIIHKDLNPRNILFDSDSTQIKIIDFGLATELSREKQALDSKLLRGSLAYISPEQTGRMNRSIDYRTDFYSLGVTFYQLLSGELPFEVQDHDDAMSWVHSHIAKEPRPLNINNSAVVNALSQIIFKLMAKNAEDRYQSALGIKNDLEYCYGQWQEHGVIADFEPGRHDISDRFEIQQKLYGREQEVDQLMRAFAEVSEGANKMFLVSGFSGIGKSALINEVHKPIVAKHGYFISGKFDQFQRNIPYSAVANAFRGLMKQLLTEPPSKLQEWKNKLLQVLGPNGQVLIDFIPELEQIIGPQPKVAHLGTEENQNRFNRLAMQFLQLFTSKEKPLVLFIDDLQWVDSASLNLIKLFMTNKDNSHFLFIGAYRDNEVDPHNPFMLAIHELKQAKVDITDLVLDPLKLQHINALVSESLHLARQHALPLSELVLHKTAGNPFFLNQFLKNLYETGLLVFDIEQQTWLWDLDKINLQQSSENVVELVVSKLERLPEATQHLLTLGACIGNVFDLHTLSIISETGLVQVANDLWPAIKSGFLLTDGDSHALLKGMSTDDSVAENEYPMVMERFLHDRVQQAAYSLINDQQKQQVHLSIARLLLQKISEEELEQSLFDIVEHYHKSQQLIVDKEELVQLAQLSLKAGNKAKDATAYFPALQYFNQAWFCYEKSKPAKPTRLGFEISKGRIECNFLLSKVEEGLQLADQAIAQYSEIEDKVEINNILILYYGGAGQMDKAIDIALNSLHFFGIKIPRNPNKAELLIELLKAKINLGKKSTDDLMNLPLYQDKDIHIIFSLLKELIAPTYLQGLTNLLPYIILRMFNLTLKHGNGPVAAFTYSGYALLWAKLDDFAEAHRFGVLAMEYNKQVDNPPMEARCYFMATSFALYWKQPFIDSQLPRKTGLQKLIDTGENFWASYIYLFGFWQEVILSKNLDDLFLLTEREIKFAEKAQQIEPFYVHTLHQNLFKNFAGLTLKRNKLDLQKGQEQQAVAYFEKNITSTMGKFYHVVCRLIMHYYQEQYDQAFTIATQASMNEDVIRDGTFTRVIYTFFTCLSALALANDSTGPDTVYPAYIKRKRKLQQWQRLCPENFSCMWWLLLGEEGRISGNPEAAIGFYEAALSAAKNLQSLFFESLVNELYAKFWLQRENKKIASVYMLEAGYLYYRWGAEGKLEDLKAKYGQLFNTAQHEAAEHSTVTYSQDLSSNSSGHSSHHSESALDVYSLVKASQALSGEIVMEKLLHKLMEFLIENAGAQRGMLILKEGDRFVIETESEIKNNEMVIKHLSADLESNSGLSMVIIRYVMRTKELVVLDDAVNNERFRADEYLQQNKIKSVLCLPLLDKGTLTGILYLENNLANNTFTPSRVETLKVLSAEIVIALENARLYRNLEEYNQTLEEKVKERTSVLRSVNETLQNRNLEIQESKKIIEEKNSNITKSIVYAQNIQHAMLPNQERMTAYFTEHFVLFKPKEIVSGDFYWLNTCSNKVFLILADCTGHGVPGAFLSMIGNMLLNSIIVEKHIHSPALILSTLHEEIRHVLRQEGKTRQTNDGMDIAVCRIDFEEQMLLFAGARRPLYLYQKTGGNLFKISGDRKSIGGRQKEEIRRFNEHMIRFCNEDILYLCSDGFVDQHNKAGKKIGSKNLEMMLRGIAELDAQSQHKKITDHLMGHQGEELQRDDITLLGIKLNPANSHFKNLSNMMNTFDLLNFRKSIIDNKIILSFEGKMSQGVLVSMVDTLQEKLKDDEWNTRQQLLRKIFAIFVELAQNIQHHSFESVEIDGKETGVGIVVIREVENFFIITSGNKVDSESAEKLKLYCEELNSLDSEQLKQRYKKQLRTARAENAKGAGIGLIEIRRKSSNPLKYELQAIDPQTLFFSMSVSLPKV